MNLQQLEYIVAVDTHRHFVKASEACFVTQATLSMMIRKLEDELGVVIFDRNKKPVLPTEPGKEIILRARRILNETSQLKNLAKQEKGIVKGELKIGIIPTIAPYLLPMFLDKFIRTYPEVKLVINELTTSNITDHLKHDKLDAAILATPLNIPSFTENVLYYEKYHLYVSGKDNYYNKKYVLSKDIRADELLLLQEGHCMRNQVLNFCELKKGHESEERVEYEAGSIETLINLVDKNMGITIIPELASTQFSKSRLSQIRYFRNPVPVREISLVTHRDVVKINLVNALVKVIQNCIPDNMKEKGRAEVLDV